VNILIESVDGVIGVDTHRDTLAAAAISTIGATLGSAAATADAGGYLQLLQFAQHHLPGARCWAVEGTSSYGAGLTEFWPLATVQLCVVHLARASLRYASKAHWGPITKALREVYTAPTVDAARRHASTPSPTTGASGIQSSSSCGAARGSSSPVPRLPAGDPPGGLHDQCDRESQRPVPASHPPPRPLPQRPGRTQGALPGHSHTPDKPG